jgi:hypothetical protein
MRARVFLAAAAGAVTIFTLGYLIYGVLLVSYLKEHMIQYAGLNKEPTPDFVPLILSNLVLAFLLAYMFDRWADIRTVTGGLKAGAIIMFLVALSKDLSFMGYMNLFKGFPPVIVDVFAETFRVALAGGVIGGVLGVMNRSDETARHRA